MHLPVTSAQTVPAGTRFRTGGDEDVQVFESLHDLDAFPEHCSIDLHTWSDDLCCLPVGSTSATLRLDHPLSLAAGDFLLLEEIAGAASGDPTDRDRTHRAVVRLVEVGAPTTDPLDGRAILDVRWDPEDALTFPLRIISETATGRVVVGAAAGNMVLVEHGAGIAEPVRLSADLDAAGRWRPLLPDGRPTYAVPYAELVTDFDGRRVRPSATALRAVDPRQALPCLTVSPKSDLEDAHAFHPRADLLASDAGDRGLVVEPEDDGTATVRFGDGVYGREPDVHEPHLARYRLGHGAAGNVGPETIRFMDGNDLIVRNPLAATGGVDPEPTEKVRTDAPHAFRVQERAVTEADYGTIVTDRFPGVQRARGTLRWTGSWYTAFVTADRVAGAAVDAAFTDRVERFLDGYRMAGVDVDVSPPQPVPVELELSVCANPDRFATDVERDVLDALSAGVTRTGRRGLFHPDNFTFGTPVHLSRVYAAALAVPGVATVRATTFQRYGELSRGELGAGVLHVHELEIAQLANDPDVPERGVLTVHVGGGR